MKIGVLDKGFVRLVDSMGSDLSIVRAARVSFDADWRTGDDEGKDEKLIRYLWKHRHSTPFEAVTVTFEVQAPIFVFRQWHRHRTQSYNEVSARYTSLDMGFYIPDPAVIGVQSKNNKQARDMDAPGPKNKIEMVARYTRACEDAFAMYEKLSDAGWPRELARAILPVSTYSRMFTTMNLRNLFHFLGLRLHEHAQYEIRVYAEAMLKIARDIAPIAVDAFADDWK